MSLPSAAALDGTVSDDAQPAPLTTTWSKVSGPGTVTFADATAVDTAATFSAEGTYVLRLTANDGQLTTTDDLTITAVVPNQPPQVNAGADQNIGLPNTAALDGTVTDDGKPGPFTTTWTQVSGPGTVTFGNAGDVDTTAAFSTDGAYVLRLTANDGEFQVSDELSITVSPPNQAPQVNAGPDQSIAIPSAAALDGTVTDDGQPGPVTTTWTQISGPGTVTFADAAAIDTTATFSAEGTYVLRLTANDSQLTTTDDVTITAIVPNQPPQVNAGVDQSIALPNTAALDGTVTDDGKPGPVTTSWTQVSGPGTVTFGNASDVDTTAAFSVDGAYVLRLTADDGEFQVTDELSITVAPPNQAPQVNAGPDQNVTLPNAATLDGTVTDDGQPGPATTTWTQVSGPGAVSFANASAVDTTATFPAVGTYVLRLTAADGEFTIADEVNVIVALPNQPPQVNAGADQSVSLPNLASLDGTVTDDGQPGPLTTTWSKVSGAGTVTFGNASAVDTTAAFSAAGLYVLRLTAHDGEFASSDDLTVNIVDPTAQPSTLDISVTVGTDDVEQLNSGAMDIGSKDLDLGSRVVGLRFDGVEVYRNATIVSAYIQFDADESGTVATQLTLVGEAADHSATFTSSSGDITSRPTTSSSVAWSVPDWTVGDAGPDQRSADISAVIQEIISRPGWNSGNALSIVITGTGHRAAETLESKGAAARLHIEFQGGTPPPNQPPQVNAGIDATVSIPNTLALDGTVSDDGQPAPVTTTWSQVSGPGTVTFANQNAVDTTASFSTDGTYVLRLTANDGALTASDEATITVLDDTAQSQTIDVSVTASSDDAEEAQSGSMDLPSGDLDIGRRTIGLRFTGVNIPPGATIVAAHVQLQADEDGAEATELTVRAEATDNAVTFSSDDFDVTSRPTTTASVSWTVPEWSVGDRGPDQRTPDLASVIQEVVSRGGWNSGNAISIILTGTGRRAAEPFDGNATAPQLHVEYYAGSPLRVAGAVLENSVAATLTDEDLESVVADAVTRWSAVGLPESQLATLQAVDVRINDLDWLGYLGLTTPAGIVIDDNGAGYGWSIDSTPSCDDGIGLEGPVCPTPTQVDLLTVVMHEQGHVLGLVDLDADTFYNDLMAASLEPGLRRLASADTLARLNDSAPADTFFSQLVLSPGAEDSHSRPYALLRSDVESVAIEATVPWLRDAPIWAPGEYHEFNSLWRPASVTLDETAVDQLLAQLDLGPAPVDDRLKSS